MGNGCDVLIVDDQPGVLMLLEETFKEDGYDVMITKEGRQALEMIFNEKPSVVLLDMKMPDMDGQEILSQVKKKDKELPVIVMTAYESSELFNDLHEEAYYYISKPFDLNELRSVVKNAIGS